MLKQFIAIITLFLISTTVTVKAQTCNYETNVHYWGYVIATYYSTSSGQCCSYCNGNSQCTGWVFDYKLGICWLKYGITYKSYQCGRISGFKSPQATLPPITNPPTTTSRTTTAIGTTTTTTRASGCLIEFNTNYPTNDIGGTYANSAEDCCNLCGANTSCVGFAYLSNERYCFFKGSINTGVKENYQGMIFGTVTVR